MFNKEIEGEKSQIAIEDSRQVLYRGDNGNMIHVASDRFQPVQPRDTLEFYRDLTEQYDYNLLHAGEFKDGKRLWALAESGKQINIDNDKVGDYLLLTTSNDGTGSTIIANLPYRFACSNAIRFALTKASSTIKIPHSTTFDDKKVKVELGIFAKTFESFETVMKNLINTPIDESGSLKLIHHLVGKKDTPEKESTRNKNIMKEIYNSIYSSAGSDLITTKGTAWGVLNGFTYYADHLMGSDSNRMNSAFNGNGNKLKNDALSILRDVAEMHKEAGTNRIHMDEIFDMEEIKAKYNH